MSVPVEPFSLRSGVPSSFHNDRKKLHTIHKDILIHSWSLVYVSLLQCVYECVSLSIAIDRQRMMFTHVCPWTARQALNGCTMSLFIPCLYSCLFSCLLSFFLLYLILPSSSHIPLAPSLSLVLVFSCLSLRRTPLHPLFPGYSVVSLTASSLCLPSLFYSEDGYRRNATQTSEVCSHWLACYSHHRFHCSAGIISWRIDRQWRRSREQLWEW